ncbi:MAG: hypothetical protein LBH05_02425 [Deferribacteraceae bacterium]|jgi:hypothetical protein|nr:hypothetical protein [Deferribacteraceae bacterium]
MKTITGELLTGLIFDYNVQKDFEIRLGTVGDFVELFDTDLAERAAKNYTFQQVALTAMRLEKLVLCNV